MKKGTIIGVLLLAATALQAQSTLTYQVGGGYVSAQGDMLTLTNLHTGYFGEVGATFGLKNPDLGLRAHAGHLVVRRDQSVIGNYCDVKNTYFGLDLLYPVTPKLAFFAGPTMNQFDITSRLGPYADTNWKLGWRVGGSYAITNHWSAGATYSFSEWTLLQPKSATGTLLASRPVNPSWLTVNVAYTF